MHTTSKPKYLSSIDISSACQISLAVVTCLEVVYSSETALSSAYNPIELENATDLNTYAEKINRFWSPERSQHFLSEAECTATSL